MGLRLTALSFLALALFNTFTVVADDDVAALLADAKATLAAHRDSPAKPAEYAQCIYNLEKAQAALESKNDTTSSLAQEVNSTLFWARRFSNVAILDEVVKLHKAGGGAKPLAKVALAEKPAAKGELAETGSMVKAKAAYEDAERFAQNKSADPFAVSLRWFQVSSQFSGTDYALKALDHAREAQSRVAAEPAKSNGAASPKKLSVIAAEINELRADKPEYKLINEGERLAAGGKYEEALAKYKESVAIRDTIPAERRMGHAHFKLAQNIGEALVPKFLAMEKEYNDAYKKAYELRGGNRYFNDRNPAWVAAQKKLADLRKEGEGAAIQAGAAQDCFDKVLKLSPGNKDFDAAAYSAVSMSRRPSLKLTARSSIKEFLKNYTPEGGEELVTYEFCKSEYERLGK